MRAVRPAAAPQAAAPASLDRTATAPPPTLTRQERIRDLWLDGPDVALFRGCEPHCVARCRLTFTNVDTREGRTVLLSWGAPGGRAARLFHIDFPQPVRLRPGCKHSVDVTFRA